MRKAKKRKKLKGEKLQKSNEEIQIKSSAKTSADNLAEQIKKAAGGLFYVSETDAKIEAFIGAQAESVTRETLLNQIKSAADVPVEERDFAEFFARLTEIQDWFGDEETATANKFALLKEILERNLRDLKVFKVGKIRLDIYVVGLEAGNVLMGVKTEAVET